MQKKQEWPKPSLVSAENSPKPGKCNTHPVLRNPGQMLGSGSLGHGLQPSFSTSGNCQQHCLLGLLRLASCLLYGGKILKGLRLAPEWNENNNPRHGTILRSQVIQRQKGHNYCAL